MLMQERGYKHVMTNAFGFGGNVFQRVDLVLDVVAELEGGHQALLDEDGLAGAGVTGRASLAGFAGEGPEATDFDGIAIDEFFTGQVQELLHHDFDVVTGNPCGLGNIKNKRLFCYVRHDLNIGLTTN